MYISKEKLTEIRKNHSTTIGDIECEIFDEGGCV